MQQNKLIQQYAQQITRSLQDAGIAHEDIMQILQQLDQAIQAQISKDLVFRLNQEQKNKLDAADEKSLSIDEFGKLLEATPEDIATRYIQKLEEYLKNLPQNLSKIKRELQQKSSLKQSK